MENKWNFWFLSKNAQPTSHKISFCNISTDNQNVQIMRFLTYIFTCFSQKKIVYALRQIKLKQ